MKRFLTLALFAVSVGAPGARGQDALRASHGCGRRSAPKPSGTAQALAIRITGLAGALLLLTAACGTEPAAFRVGCSSIQSVEVGSVGSGVVPRIDWEPGCSVAAVEVYEAHRQPPSEDSIPPLPTEHPDFVAGSLMWGIASPDSLGNRLEASVRYGEAPVDALEQKPADPLQEDQPYLVRLAVRNPDGFTGLVAWGLFTP